MSPVPPLALHLEAHLDAQLSQAMGRLEAALSSSVPPVADLARHVAGYRGKMLRPRLALLTAWGLSGNENLAPMGGQIQMLAAVLEMIHLSTLVHDDILDEATLRRGGATLNALHGNEAAVMLGDWLLARAYRLCAEIGIPAVSVAVADATAQVCAGEILQLTHRNDWALTQATYNAIIEGKTAALTAACCRIPCLLYPGRGDADAMHAFGLHLGAAFQMADDVLDLASTDAEAGKTLGRDLAEGKLTLPVLFALEQQPALRSDLAIAAGTAVGDTAAAAARVLVALQDGGAFDAVRHVAADRVRQALEHLDRGLPPGPARDQLALRAAQVLDRRK